MQYLCSTIGYHTIDPQCKAAEPPTSLIYLCIDFQRRAFKCVNPGCLCCNITCPMLTFIDLFLYCIIPSPHRKWLELGCVGHSPRLRKSKTLCMVYFLLEAWSSNLRTRICSLLKTVSQSIRYTMYRPTCNLTWGHKTKESMRGNQGTSPLCWGTWL